MIDKSNSTAVPSAAPIYRCVYCQGVYLDKPTQCDCLPAGKPQVYEQGVVSFGGTPNAHQSGKGMSAQILSDMQIDKIEERVHCQTIDKGKTRHAYARKLAREIEKATFSALVDSLLALTTDAAARQRQGSMR